MNIKKYGYCYESEELSEEFLKKVFKTLDNLDNSIEEAKIEWVEQCAMWGTDAAKKTVREKGSPYIFEYDMSLKIFTRLEKLEIPNIEYVENN